MQHIHPDQHRSITHQRSLAFSLVEMLVVMGVIGILISILLPVAFSARRAARLANCASNQHVLLQGVIAYAVDNDGKIPVPQVPTNWTTSATAMGVFTQLEPQTSYILSDVATTSTTLVKDKPDGWGKLYKCGYITNPRVFYDEPQVDYRASFITYNLDAGWGAVPDSGNKSNWTRAGYFLNPQGFDSLKRLIVSKNCYRSDGLSPANIFSDRGKPPGSYDAFLTIDRPALSNARSNHGYYWNAGYPDGSVRSYSSEEAIRIASTYSNTDLRTQVWYYWPLYETFLRSLIQ